MGQGGVRDWVRVGQGLGQGGVRSSEAGSAQPRPQALPSC